MKISNLKSNNKYKKNKEYLKNLKILYKTLKKKR